MVLGKLMHPQVVFGRSFESLVVVSWIVISTSRRAALSYCVSKASPEMPAMREARAHEFCFD
jgi:hypothetical protein